MADLIDLVSHILERPHAVFAAAPDIGLDVGIAEVRAPGDAQVLGQPVKGIDVGVAGMRQRVWVGLRGSDDAIDVERRVAHGAHHRPVNARIVPAQHLEWPHRDAAEGHLEAGHPAP